MQVPRGRCASRTRATRHLHSEFGLHSRESAFLSSPHVHGAASAAFGLTPSSISEPGAPTDIVVSLEMLTYTGPLAASPVRELGAWDAVVEVANVPHVHGAADAALGLPPSMLDEEDPRSEQIVLAAGIHVHGPLTRPSGYRPLCSTRRIPGMNGLCLLLASTYTGRWRGPP
jgi:hypothetical protein